MFDKYKAIEIFEIENGWVVKTIEATDPKNIDQIEYTSAYCKTINEVAELIVEQNSTKTSSNNQTHLTSNETKNQSQDRKFHCNNPECKKEITKQNVAYCLNNKDIFKGKAYCQSCQDTIKKKQE